MKNKLGLNIKTTAVSMGILLAVGGQPVEASESLQGAKAVRAMRAAGEAVRPAPDGNLYAEAEEFVLNSSGWRVGVWGENYYAATFANTFLSRKMYLEAAADLTNATAEMPVEITEPGDYLVLVRYEAPYNFESRFRVQIEQNGKTVFDRLYGALENEKIWAFGRGIQQQAKWEWGAVENIVWEGHEAEATLEGGKAIVRLIAVEQPAPAARRNIDMVMLTKDQADVAHRIENERYLPLDGLLTQQGDVYLKLEVPADGPDMTLTIPPCREHSPYWVHLRTWGPKTLNVGAGESSDWEEIGSLLDSLNDSQMYLTARAATPTDVPLRYTVEIGRKMPNQDQIETIARFDGEGSTLDLIFPASVRYTPLVQTQEEAIRDLLTAVQHFNPRGQKPDRTTVFAFIPTHTRQPDDSPINIMAHEFAALHGISPSVPASGYHEVRYRIRDPEDFRAHLEELSQQDATDELMVASFGDEIRLPLPQGEEANKLFHQWLSARGLAAAYVLPGAKDWTDIAFDLLGDEAKTKPRQFYYSRLFAYDYGIARIKESTDLLREYFPDALSGANFSPHMGFHYLHDVYQWIRAFREKALILPWSEGYSWQVAKGSQQMYTISMAMLRAGLRDRPADPILWYVMTHTPGNTPASWRRELYTSLAYGAKIINLYQHKPLAAFGTTENYSQDLAMYEEVMKGLFELGTFEDFVQDGVVRNGRVGFWFSEASDIWRDQENPFGANKRGMYIAMLHRAPQLDVVTADDAIDGTIAEYDSIILTDRTVDTAASKKLAEWVKAGGRLILTAGAGTKNEYQEPNTILPRLTGQTAETLHVHDDSIRFIKQDLPWAEPVTHVSVTDGETTPVFGAVAVLGTVEADEVQAVFSDQSPAAFRRSIGMGHVVSMGFLPGLSYFKPSIPNIPVDRGSTDTAMAHYVPSAFCQTTGALLDAAMDGQTQDITCSNPLIAFRVVESKHGLLIPLTNWAGAPDERVELSMATDRDFSKVELASGEAVQVQSDGDRTVFTFSLDIADALVLHYAGN